MWAGTPVDLSLAWLPFETEALHRSALVSIDRIEMRVPHVKNLILYKLVATRPRDLDDAQQLLAIHRSRVDLPKVRARLAELCGVLEDEERLRQFDSLVRWLP